MAKCFQSSKLCVVTKSMDLVSINLFYLLNSHVDSVITFYFVICRIVVVKEWKKEWGERLDCFRRINCLTVKVDPKVRYQI
jgi:hypothetical protein